jgi:hypothetical protein
MIMPETSSAKLRRGVVRVCGQGVPHAGHVLLAEKTEYSVHASCILLHWDRVCRGCNGRCSQDTACSGSLANRVDRLPTMRWLLHTRSLRIHMSGAHLPAEVLIRAISERQKRVRDAWRQLVDGRDDTDQAKVRVVVPVPPAWPAHRGH